MIHPTHSRTFHDKDSANTVFAMLNSEDFMPERNARYTLSGPTTAFGVLRVNAKVDAVGPGANATLLANALPARSRSDIVLEDWSALFDAVRARLRLIIAERHATSVESQPDEADRIRADVLQCLEALDQLHAALKDELGQRPQS